MALPPEIWEIIFDYSDAISLVNMRSVCTLWQEIIDTMLEKKNHWYKQCVKDVPSQFWYIFYDKHDPEIEIDKIAPNDWKRWLTLYKSWLFGKYVQNCITETGKFEPVPKHPARQEITCMTSLCNLMAIGTTNGFVYIYDISRLDEDPIFTVDNLEFVTSIKLVKNYHTWLISCSINNHVKIWNIELKKLVKQMTGRLIGANSNHLCVAMGSRFYIDDLIGSTSFSKLHNALHIIVLIAFFDTDTVTIYTGGGSYAKYSIADPQVRHSSTFLKVPNNFRVLYAFKPEILAYIKESGSVGFSVKGKKWQRYQIDYQLDVLNGAPTALYIFGHLLIIGSNTGTIHMYHVEDFERVDLSTTSSKVITFDEDAITCMEIFFHEEEQYLAVVQTKTVHVVQFLTTHSNAIL